MPPVNFYHIFGFGIPRLRFPLLGNSKRQHALLVPNTKEATMCNNLRKSTAFSSLSPFTYPITAGDRWGTTDDFTASFLNFSLFSTDLWNLANSRPVHFPMFSSHLSFCMPCLFPPYIVPCKMVLARPNEQETCPYHCSLRLFMVIRRSSYGLIASCILAQTSPLVTWSLYEVRSILR